MEHGIAVWSAPAWRASAVGWLDERLGEIGRRRTGAVAFVHVRPWATTASVPTDRGVAWLKVSGPATAFEAGLYGLLHRAAPGHVVRPLVVDPAGGRLVLEDGGPAASDLPAIDELLDVLTVAFGRYAELQRLVAPHADELVALGLVDMRPARLPERFGAALALVRGEPAERLRAMEPEVERWASTLAASPVPNSIDHNDLHPDNVLVGPPPRVYDWGDAVVAHPFASMFVALDFVREHLLGCGADDPRLTRLLDAYLAGFADLATPAELRETVALARRLARIAHALTWARLLATLPHDDMAPDWHAMPARILEGLLTTP